MTKVVIRTDDVAGFFARAKDAARRADQGQLFLKARLPCRSKTRRECSPFSRRPAVG